ncbi:hypothetical protein D3C76_883400 [compost metagenome]
MDHLPVGAGETLGVLVQDDLGQVLAEDRRVTGATGVDFRQVHDFHFAVVAQETALFAFAREADTPGDVLVQVAQHHQRFDQEHRFGRLVRPQAQIVANPLCRAIAFFRIALVWRQAIFVVEFVEVELAGVVDQFRDIQRDVRTAAAQANQAHRREFLIVVLFVVTFQMRWAREHHVAQAVEVVEDAIGVGFGEVQVLLGRQRARRRQWLRRCGAVRRRAQRQVGKRRGWIVFRSHCSPCTWAGGSGNLLSSTITE